jgi:hypothetical protein
MLRGLVLGTLSKCGHSGTIENALKLFDSYIKKNVVVHPELRNFIFATAVRKNPKGADMLLKVYETCGKILSMSCLNNVDFRHFGN